MADILTRGRLVFGVGRGYHSREVETFGNPMLDAEANRELFEEQVEVILKAFGQESFAHQGKHYTIPPEVPYRGYRLHEITLVPRPLHQPVEIWQPIVSGSARSLDFMARHGIKGVISATAEAVVQRWFHDYQAAARRHGRELQLGEDLLLGFRMCIDETVEQAIQRARPYFEEHAKFMGPLGMLRYSEELVSAVAARQAPVADGRLPGERCSQSHLAVRACPRHRRLPEGGGAAVPRAGARHDRLGPGNAARPHDRAAHPLRQGGHAGVPPVAARASRPRRARNPRPAARCRRRRRRPHPPRRCG